MKHTDVPLEKFDSWCLKPNSGSWSFLCPKECELTHPKCSLLHWSSALSAVAELPVHRVVVNPWSCQMSSVFHCCGFGTWLNNPFVKNGQWKHFWLLSVTTGAHCVQTGEWHIKFSASIRSRIKEQCILMQAGLSKNLFPNLPWTASLSVSSHCSEWHWCVTGKNSGWCRHQSAITTFDALKGHCILRCSQMGKWSALMLKLTPKTGNLAAQQKVQISVIKRKTMLFTIFGTKQNTSFSAQNKKTLSFTAPSFFFCLQSWSIKTHSIHSCILPLFHNQNWTVSMFNLQVKLQRCRPFAQWCELLFQLKIFNFNFSLRKNESLVGCSVIVSTISQKHSWTRLNELNPNVCSPT